MKRISPVPSPIFTANLSAAYSHLLPPDEIADVMYALHESLYESHQKEEDNPYDIKLPQITPMLA